MPVSIFTPMGRISRYYGIMTGKFGYLIRNESVLFSRLFDRLIIEVTITLFKSSYLIDSYDSK